METWKQFDQNVISHSAAHHLMAIDELLGKHGYARVSDVARLLQITRGSVSISLQPLKKAGLVLQDENRHLQLSAQGQELVDAIKTKRLLVQRLLVDILGMPTDIAAVDACKLEHLVSNQTAQHLVLLHRFVDSGAREAQAFVEALRQYQADCDHDPSRCATCTDACMVERIDREQ